MRIGKRRLVLTIVMTPNLLLVLTLGVYNDFGNQLGQDVFEQFRSELEAGPDMTLF